MRHLVATLTVLLATATGAAFGVGATTAAPPTAHPNCFTWNCNYPGVCAPDCY